MPLIPFDDPTRYGFGPTALRLAALLGRSVHEPQAIVDHSDFFLESGHCSSHKTCVVAGCLQFTIAYREMVQFFSASETGIGYRPWRLPSKYGYSRLIDVPAANKL